MENLDFSFVNSCIQFVATSFTAFNALPIILLALINKEPFQFSFCILGVISSFMYHLCDAFGLSILFLEIESWHRLENLVIILGFVNYSLINSKVEIFNCLLNNSPNTKASIQLSFFIIIMIILENAWSFDIIFFIIFMMVLIFLCNYNQCLHIHNFWKKQSFQIGIISLVVSLIAFYISQNPEIDNLKIWHGIWHLTITNSIFYFYQIKNEKMIHIWQLKCLVNNLKIKCVLQDLIE